MNKIVLVTGGFDPLHSGHIANFENAKSLARLSDGELWIGVNSDKWLSRKKGMPFMSVDERKTIINALGCVDNVFEFDDTDDTAIDAIQYVQNIHPDAQIIFANGGDRTVDNIPEMIFDNVEFVFGIGGTDKKNSSSWILDEWKTQKTKRDWGYWRVLDHKPTQGYKVKELVIYPGKSLSDQKHFKRSEQWMVLEGIVKMQTEWNNLIDIKHLKPHGLPYEIGKQVWHKASNPGDKNAHILEIQWGKECIEDDIERR